MNNIASDPVNGPQRDPSKEKFWRTTLREHAAGGQSVRAFCRERGLSEPSFYAWRRAIAQRDRKPAGARTAAKAKFVELRPKHAPPARDGAPLEIVAGPHRLLVRAGCDRVLLGEALAALASLHWVALEG